MSILQLSCNAGLFLYPFLKGDGIPVYKSRITWDGVDVNFHGHIVYIDFADCLLYKIKAMPKFCIFQTSIQLPPFTQLPVNV